MNTYIINHVDCDELMEVEAETASQAKYKNFKDWNECFGRYKNAFWEYLDGLISCRKFKEREENNG